MYNHFPHPHAPVLETVTLYMSTYFNDNVFNMYIIETKFICAYYVNTYMFGFQGLAFLSLALQMKPWLLEQVYRPADFFATKALARPEVVSWNSV